MMKRMSVVMAGVAMLVLIAACGAGDPAPTATPVPPVATATPTPVPPTPTPTVSVPDSPQGALQWGRDRWESSGITAYAFTGGWTCFCPQEYLAEAQVAVYGGEVTGVSSADPGIDTIPAPERFVSIEGLFALIQEAFDRNTSSVEVSYDGTYGYPVDLFIDYDARMADEEARFTISSFTPR